MRAEGPWQQHAAASEGQQRFSSGIPISFPVRQVSQSRESPKPLLPNNRLRKNSKPRPQPKAKTKEKGPKRSNHIFPVHRVWVGSVKVGRSRPDIFLLDRMRRVVQEELVWLVRPQPVILLLADPQWGENDFPPTCHWDCEASGIAK